MGDGDSRLADCPDDRLDILLLVNEPAFRSLLLDVLEDARVTVATTVAEAKTMLACHRYELVVVTNFGLSPHEAVSVIPASHDYAAFLLTGVTDARVEEECLARKIRRVKTPLELEKLRNSLLEAAARS